LNPASDADLLMLLAPSARAGLLLLLLGAAAWIDCREMRVPNWLTAGGMAAGVALNTFGAQAVGVMPALGGLASGLLLLLPLYALRVLGAGDVKLLAMTGAFLGVPAFFPALLAISIAAGACALLLVLMRRVPSLQYSAFPRAVRMPYAPSVLVGTAAFLAIQQVSLA
jgi:prepilin peptidase CpaA